MIKFRRKNGGHVPSSFFVVSAASVAQLFCILTA